MTPIISLFSLTLYKIKKKKKLPNTLSLFLVVSRTNILLHQIYTPTLKKSPNAGGHP